MSIPTKALVLLAAVALASYVTASCNQQSAVAQGNAVLDRSAEGYYFIPHPAANERYSWGLPLLTTRPGRRVRLTSIRLVHAPSELRDISFVRIRFADMGSTIGIIRTPTSVSPDPRYKPGPAVGIVYDDVNDDQILVEFTLASPVTARLADVEIRYEEEGREWTQRIKAELALGRNS